MKKQRSCAAAYEVGCDAFESWRNMIIVDPAVGGVQPKCGNWHTGNFDRQVATK